jgi:DNA modification methylase
MSFRVITSDVMDGLRQLPDESVHCVVTSPPYWGLRDYGVAGQIGLEATPDAFVARMVEVFREVRRVLRKDGTLWLNLGDSYASTPSGAMRSSGLDGGKATQQAFRLATSAKVVPPGFKPKDLVGIPWRVAFALQADGWWLRSDIIWSKPNPMPESVTDRPTKAHEYLFLLTKAERYYYDAEAIKDVAAPATGWAKSHKDKETPNGVGNGELAKSLRFGGDGGTRNKRSVWTIATAPFPEAHFACVDAQTECLTATGWMRHDQLRPGMSAAQFDIASGKLSWAPVQDVASYDVTEQDMIVGSCRDMDMWLTPNHRTVIQRRHPRTRDLQEPIVIRADEMKASHSVPTAADWAFDGDASVPLEWAELLGWYVAEGHESKDSLSVELYQSEAANAPKCRRIEELLRQTGAEWTKASCKRRWRGRQADMTAYRVMGYAAVRLREMAPGKRLPWGSVLWSADRIAAIVDGLVGGDGHTRLDGRRSFVQKDKAQCDLFQALAMRLGYSATLSVRADGVGVVYVTSHRTRSFRGTNGKGSAPSVEKYTGVVWCPKLPNGTWVARRSGRPFITGNTFPPELPEICIKAGCPVGGTVLDPFAGAGTTLLVADRLQRNAIGIELNPEYVAIAERRLANDRGGLLDFIEQPRKAEQLNLLEAAE